LPARIFLNVLGVFFFVEVNAVPRKKPLLDGKIVKPEDKVWKEWFDEIGEKEHDKYLHSLGLDEEDIEEWHSMHGKLDEFGESLAEAVEEKPKKKKK